MFDSVTYREQSSKAAQGQVLSDQCAPRPGGHEPPREAEGSADVAWALLDGALSRRGAGAGKWGARGAGAGKWGLGERGGLAPQ